MDGAAVFLRQPVGVSSSCYSATAAPSSSSSKQSKTSSASIAMRQSGILSSGFCDQGHLQYYYSSNLASSSSSSGMKTRISAKQDTATKDKTQKKMKKKKQLKLLKGLSRDLSTFSQIGFGLDYDELIDQIKGKEISEAAELLLVELQKIKANKKELKRKTKEEKARLKSSQIRNSLVDCEMSSSSSSSSESSSSDSECGEVVDMKSLKRAQLNQTAPQQVIDEPTTTSPIPIIQTVTALEQSLEPVIAEANPVATECCSGNENSSIFPTSSKKIEVCLGGKCKKSGGSALLEKFQSVVGIEGAVSGCKCMGKCREGPVVKVFDGGLADNNSSVLKVAAANSLCIGVGLEDVDMIVANLLGESSNHLGLVGAS